MSFKEVQRFNKWWHYTFMILPFLFAELMSYFIMNDLIKTNDEQKHPILLFIIILSLLIGIWFFCMKLKTIINQNGIEVIYYCIPFVKRKILWTEIEKIEVISYLPFWEYSGWGVRWSLNGWCYNVRGKNGIKITYYNKDVFLIGKQFPEQMQQIINNYTI